MTERKSTYASYLNSPRPSFKHSTYFPVYDRLFSPWIGRSFTFVEVGVFNGGSLFMWRDYFGPQARIIGIDFNPNARRLEADGFEILIGNQADPAFWRQVAADIGGIDVLLDDGGHTFEQQIVTVDSILPTINDGGLIVVEDTHTSYQADFGGPSPRSFVSWAKTVADGINHRFSDLDGLPREDTIFSVAFYESIVVFEINRLLARAPSTPTLNTPPETPVRDFRYADSRTITLLRRVGLQIDRVRTLPVVGRALAAGLKRVFALRNGFKNAGLGRYFRY
jgi:hypothetical protein